MTKVILPFRKRLSFLNKRFASKFQLEVAESKIKMRKIKLKLSGDGDPLTLPAESFTPRSPNDRCHNRSEIVR